MDSHVEVVLAKTIISINSGGIIDIRSIKDNISNFADLQPKIELCNAIVVPHRKRYEQCYTDEQRASEINLMLSNYRAVFGKDGMQFVSDELLENAFKLMYNHDYLSNSFKALCFKVVEQLRLCDVIEVKNSLLLKIISLLIRGSLFGSEPYDTILADCVSELDTITKQYGRVKRIRFLE